MGVEDRQVVLDVSRPGRGAGGGHVLARWVAARQVFELESLSPKVLIRVAWPVVTAEHVVAAVEAGGFRLEPAAFDALFSADEQVRAVAGDPLIVGDPGSGAVGVATPDGRVVERVSGAAGHWWFGDVGREVDPAVVLESARAVLMACAPVTLQPAGTRVRRWAVGVAVRDFVATAFPAPSHLGLNVRAVQDWALVAVDVSEPARRMRSAELLGRVFSVEQTVVRSAARSLRDMDGSTVAPVSSTAGRGGPGRAGRSVRRRPAAGTEIGL
jgi:hypothetical protein